MSGDQSGAVAMSKTLDRGLSVLEFVADNPSGVTLTEVARHLDVHRTIAHRLIGTLELHQLVRRTGRKTILPGVGVVRLAESVYRVVQSIAQPILQDMAEELGATAHLVVATSLGLGQVVLVTEPRNAEAHIAFRPGRAYPLDQGSAGIAILSAQPPRDGERKVVTLAREQGYAVSRAEIIPNAWGVSAAVPSELDAQRMAIGVTLLNGLHLEDLGPVVIQYAARLANTLESGARR